MLFRSIYRLSVRLAERALPLAARFDKKIARGVDARRGVLERLAAWGQAQRDPKRPLVWVHAPSVGEGLQAKPVLETLRAERPQWQLVYTFFSPSAERLARTLPVDLTDYLPFDRAAARHEAGADFRDGGARQLAAALAGAPLGGARLPRARPRGDDQ